MRRAFVVLVLLAMMVGLKALQTHADDGSDSMTLAAIGFVVLAAFAIAELGARMTLPKVTGYILSGVVLGPFALKILSGDVVVEMTMFSKLALGLIATSAGLELDLRALSKLAKTLSTTIAIKIVTGVVLVGGALVAGEMTLSVLGIEDTSTIVALAIVFAALSLGTSPAIALAIISENKAKGRLSELVLGAAIVKDVVVVIALAVAVAIAKGLMPVDEAAAGAHDGGAAAVLLHVGRELGTSIGAGAILGGLLIAYLRWIKAEMLLFVAAMVLVVAEVSTALHLELLLVFIVAGLVVRNFSHYEHDLLHPLETVSLPVFIVFFTNAGASVNIDATLAVLPLAFAMSVARALGFVAAGRIGGRVGGESEPVRRLAWLGYLPQAGVTLGLVGLASDQLPELAEHIVTLGMAVVAINLLVGPITMRVALRAAGEIGDAAATSSVTSGDDADAAPTGVPGEELESPVLREIVREVHQGDQAALRRLIDRNVAPWTRAMARRYSEPLRDTAEEAALTTIVDLLERIPADDAPERVEAALARFADRSTALESIPSEIAVPLEAQWRSRQPDDSFTTGMRKSLARLRDMLRLRFAGGRTRTVPTRMAARTVVEPALAHGLEEAMSSWYRAEARIFEELRRCALGSRTAAETADAIDETAARFIENLRIDLDVTADRSAHALAHELARVGSPVRSVSQVRYSRVEPELARWRARLVEDAEAWGSRRDAAARLVRITTVVALVERRLRRMLDDQILAVAQEAFEMVAEEVQGQHRRLQQIVEQTRALPAFDESAVSRLKMEVSALVPRPVQKKLRAVAGRLRRATSGTALGSLSREASVDAAGKESIVHSLATIIDAPRPAKAEVVTLDITETVQAYLSAELGPALEQLLGELWSSFAAARETMGTCESAAEFVLSTTLREDAEEPATPEAVAQHLAQTAEPLAGADETVRARGTALAEQMHEAVGGIDEHLVDAIARATGRTTSTGPVSRAERIRAWGQALYRRYGKPAVELAQRGIRRLRGEAAHGIGRHYRLRSGAERADAADVREYLREQYGEVGAELPPMYRALFSPEPVRDPRLFVANRDALQEIVRVERAWQQAPSQGNAVLVCGGVGMGKSSLVQIARLKLATRRVIVVPTRDRAEEPTLFAYLARELGCEPDAKSVETALARGRTAIVVDDLHEWVSLGADGIEALDELLNLIVHTQPSTFWLLSIARQLLEVVELVLPMRGAFAQVVELRGLGRDDLEGLLSARQQLSGLELEFPASLRARWIGRLLRRSLRESYMRALTTSSSGNPRRALRAWLRRAHALDDRVISLDPVGLEWGLPFLRQLTATQLAIVALLVRSGRRRASELVAALSIEAHHVERELRFLTASGVVREDGDWFSLAAVVRDDVSKALAEFGATRGAA